MAEYTTHIIYYPQNARRDLDDTHPEILGAKAKVHQDFDLGPRTQLRTAGHMDTRRTQHYQDKIRIVKVFCIRHEYLQQAVCHIQPLIEEV